MAKFKNKYRIPSARVQKWDYGSNAAYFITICTQDREHYFGKILDNCRKDAMRCIFLSQIGKIAEQEWLKTPGIRPDMNIVLDEFVIMPNHFHGIIIIGENKYNMENRHRYLINKNVLVGVDVDVDRDAMHGVSTITPNTITPDITQPNNSINQFGPQSKNLGSIIRGFKSSVTVYARKHNIDFGWQERYYDRIICNDKEFMRIKKYTIDNPQKWHKDEFY